MFIDEDPVQTNDHELLANSGLKVTYKGFEICLDYCGYIIIDGTTKFRGLIYPSIQDAINDIKKDLNR